MRKEGRSGFTLIELLIVVLIIAILAAIAIPNFMEFQTRAKVSRVKSDQRTIATAIEAYCVDTGTYPNISDESCLLAGGQWGLGHGLCDLTTPIAYLSSLPRDPFIERDRGTGDASHLGDIIYELHSNGGLPSRVHELGCVLGSPGPDLWSEFNGPGGSDSWYYPDSIQYVRYYDPTNGTASSGDIMRFMPGGEGYKDRVVWY